MVTNRVGRLLLTKQDSTFAIRTVMFYWAIADFIGLHNCVSMTLTTVVTEISCPYGTTIHTVCIFRPTIANKRAVVVLRSVKLAVKSEQLAMV